MDALGLGLGEALVELEDIGLAVADLVASAVDADHELAGHVRSPMGRRQHDVRRAKFNPRVWGGGVNPALRDAAVSACGPGGAEKIDLGGQTEGVV
ncbi:hypothetical protein GCM10017056_17060 [Seohaeicola zhoushanensis]|uniref:Uncharacterized protein n=1 Tax=Seohaeicola zhoushanensis TaxID=1569283 RepID=A0A8J3GWL4_9RHOB|nr:hypothetical protein GCM10017056_17060 [Seohaeicola zhoushanensis]